ncbi:MAG: hypothetical protein ACI4BD_04405 [Paludibacteraceae bacterium]
MRYPCATLRLPAADDATTLREGFRNGRVLILCGDKTHTLRGEQPCRTDRDNGKEAARYMD